MTATKNPERLLSSVTMARFVAHGSLRMDAVVPAELNAEAMEILPAGIPMVPYGTPVPEAYPEGSFVRRLIDLPEVAGALHSLVGPRPRIDHHAVHVVPAGQKVHERTYRLRVGVEAHRKEPGTFKFDPGARARQDRLFQVWRHLGMGGLEGLAEQGPDPRREMADGRAGVLAVAQRLFRLVTQVAETRCGLLRDEWLHGPGEGQVYLELVPLLRRKMRHAFADQVQVGEGEVELLLRERVSVGDSRPDDSCQGVRDRL
jgi:hypothetical protein